MRRYTLADSLIAHADQVLKTLTPNTAPALRANPAQTQAKVPLDNQQQQLIAGLMRVNHTGEVCAQALYHGQALTAKLPTVREEMQRAALEEQDHLAWCEDRLKELNSHISVLNPLWYGLPFGIGAAAGLAGNCCGPFGGARVAKNKRPRAYARHCFRFLQSGKAERNFCRSRYHHFYASGHHAHCSGRRLYCAEEKSGYSFIHQRCHARDE